MDLGPGTSTFMRSRKQTRRFTHRSREAFKVEVSEVQSDDIENPPDHSSKFRRRLKYSAGYLPDVGQLFPVKYATNYPTFSQI